MTTDHRALALKHRKLAAKEHHAKMREWKARRLKMVKMYRDGLTISAIGRAFNLSRQRILQCLQREGAIS